MLLGVSGSVATVKSEELATKLAQIPAEVKIVSTDAARHFFKDDWNLDIPILGETFARRWQAQTSGACCERVT